MKLKPVFIEVQIVKSSASEAAGAGGAIRVDAKRTHKRMRTGLINELSA